MPLEPEKYTPASVLVIMPHADDIEFGLAGSVARWVQQGSQVTYCLVTDGSAGSNTPNADLEELIEQRQAEQRSAAEKVGVHDLIFMGYRDGTLQPTLELRRHLTRLIRKIKPERVVTFDPSTFISDDNNYVNHPDHRAAGEAALYAVFPSSETRPIFPELLAEGLEPHHVSDLYFVLTDKPNVYVDISEHLDAKLEALRCHVSQLNEEAVQMVKKWSEEGGKKFGVGAAETFRVLNFRREQPATAETEEATNN